MVIHRYHYLSRRKLVHIIFFKTIDRQGIRSNNISISLLKFPNYKCWVLAKKNFLYQSNHVDYCNIFLNDEKITDCLNAAQYNEKKKFETKDLRFSCKKIGISYIS